MTNRLESSLAEPWETPHGTIHTEDIHSRLASFDRSAIAGRRILVYGTQDVETCLALLLLDEVAEAVYLPARDIPDDVVGHHVRELGLDSVLGPNPAFGLDHLPFQNGGQGRVDLPAREHEIPPIVTTWRIPTSGTTQIPRAIAHTTASLTRKTRRGARWRSLRWGLVYAPQRFAGVQVVLQAIVSGASLVFVDRSQPIEKQVESLAAGECTALSATPTLWRQILRCQASNRLALKQITLGGEIVDDAVLDALRTKYPDARITHIYASTEAGVGFSVHDGLAGFPFDYLKSHNPPIKVQDNRLLIAGENNNWIDTGDLVQCDGERCYFLGRDSGMINVGGNKVMPEEIEQVVLAVRGVLSVRVEGRPSSMMGQLVEAKVVPEQGYDFSELKNAVLAHCRAELPRHKVPAFVTLAQGLEANPSGKIVRRPQ